MLLRLSLFFFLAFQILSITHNITYVPKPNYEPHLKAPELGFLQHEFLLLFCFFNVPCCKFPSLLVIYKCALAELTELINENNVPNGLYLNVKNIYHIVKYFIFFMLFRSLKGTCVVSSLMLMPFKHNSSLILFKKALQLTASSSGTFPPGSTCCQNLRLWKEICQT